MAVKVMYFVHGTTTDNAAKLCSGWKEAMLNDLGKEQALNLGKVSKERGDKFDIVFRSQIFNLSKIFKLFCRQFSHSS